MVANTVPRNRYRKLCFMTGKVKRYIISIPSKKVRFPLPSVCIGQKIIVKSHLISDQNRTDIDSTCRIDVCPMLARFIVRVDNLFVDCPFNSYIIPKYVKSYKLNYMVNK